MDININILPKTKVINMSLLVLASIGDAVETLNVRTKLATSSDIKAGELQRQTASIVKAQSQAEKIDKILPLLSDEESNIFMRARNTKKGTKAKNSSAVEYNKATGFEAILGFLYLTGNFERLEFILNFKEKESEEG